MRKTLLLLFIAFVNTFFMNSQSPTSNPTSKSAVGNFINSYDNRNIKTELAFGKQPLPGKSVIQHNTKLAKTTIFSETFSSNSLPDGWSNIDNATGGTWLFNNPGNITINTTTGSTGFAIFNSGYYLSNDGKLENADLISPVIDCSALTLVYFSFEHYYRAGYSSYGEVFISNDDGSTWTSLESWGSSSTQNAAIANYDITSFAAGKSQVKIKWNWKGYYCLYWAIDDILIYEPFEHDLNVSAISPLVAENGSTITPVVTVSNLGTSTESSYTVILSDGGSYSNTVNVTTPLNGNTTFDVDFPDFTVGESQCNLTATVVLSTDEVAANNTLSAILNTYIRRAALASQYNYGSSKNGLYWLPSDEFETVGSSTQQQGLAWKDSVLYGITYGGIFGKINYSDASFVEIGTTEVPATFFTSLSCDPVTGKIYASALSGLYPDFTLSLYEMNLTTGIGRFVASSPTVGTFSQFAFDNAGQLYAIRHIPRQNGILYAVNKDNAEMIEIGSLGGIVSSNFQPMAWDVHENKMYLQASSPNDGEMKGTYLLDLETGNAVPEGIPLDGQIIAMEIPDFDANLKNLEVDGSTIGNFSPGKFVYHIILPSGTTLVPTVTATAFYDKATVFVTDATTLPGSASILVTAADGTKHTYTINFSVSANTNARLSDLKVNGSTIEGFSEDVTNYNMLLPSGTTTVPAVAATTVDDNASLSIGDAVSVPGSTTITVTAADGTSLLVYTVNFTIAEATDATLTGLRYNGISIEEFNSATYNYDVELPYGTTIVPYIRVTKTDVNASASVSDASSLPGSSIVTVTAADGLTQLTYTLNFTVALPSTNASLSDLTVSGNTVTGFNATVYSYDVELPYGTAAVPAVGATVADNTATRVINVASSLPGSTTVVVTAQDGSTELTYTINFIIAPPSTNASLSDLTVSGNTVTGFNATAYSYDVELPYGTTAVPAVGATVADNTASKVITDAASLPGTTTVVVTAQDGSTQNTYTISFSVSVINGISDQQENSIKIFPIPASDKIYIELDETINQVVVIDMNGHKVLAESFASKEVDLNTSGLGIGTYIVCIYSSNEVLYRKIQISR